MKLLIDQSFFDAIIFDFSGVLLLDMPWHEAAWRETFESLSSRARSTEEMAWFVHGRTNRDIFCTLLDRELSDSELDDLIEAKESKYRRICQEKGAEFQLVEGAADLLTALREEEIPMAIATSAGEKNMRFLYKELALSRWFDWESIVYDDGRMRGKPAPDVYLKAAALLDVKPKKIAVVEDTISGMQAAKNAGVGLVIAVGDTWSPAREHGHDLYNIRLNAFADLDARLSLVDSASGYLSCREF